MSSVLFSERSAAISSFRIPFNSSTPKYLSLATLSSILLIIFMVVSTPTSEEIQPQVAEEITYKAAVDIEEEEEDDLPF